ncbi:MAG: hypothetical protein MJ025_04885, partial [Victivallaceae bacterium]|nr:hypothetical protein [Victivallaceae bacterium]
MLNIDCKVKPELDPGFVPAVLWNRRFAELAAADKGARRVALTLERPNGAISRHDAVVLSDSAANRKLNVRFVERIVKFMLWSFGGWKVGVYGAPELADELRAIYSANGERAFDWQVMGERIYDRDFTVTTGSYEDAPAEKKVSAKLGGNFDGCRIGFDLGGSDRKCAAVMNGKTVHSEEVVWDPYFQSDIEYHRAGIIDSLKRAAAKLPRIDAIGGSAAGVYVDNQPRIASLFRGIPEKDFATKVRPIFLEIAKEFPGVPFVVLNDGEVTALAGAISLKRNSLIGLAMGTSEAVGYVTPDGNLTDYLNELAFAPVDYREEDAPMDEWSGDFGVGAMYLSQQAVGRLAPKAGFDFGKMPLPEQLKAVQKAMAEGDKNAAAIYRTIGVYLGYAIAHYADFYHLENLLLLGRVSSGEGGSIMIETARELLKSEFPELKVDIHI